MSTINNWSLYCETESTNVYRLLFLGSPTPTTCPNDTGHTIDPDQTHIIDTFTNVDNSKKGIDDTSNSTTVPLVNNTTFTGTSIDASAYSSVITSCFTDQSGVLYMEFSTDNSHWDDTSVYIIASNQNEVHRLTISKKYFRVRFNNNSGFNQTFIRLQTMLGFQQTFTIGLNTQITQDQDMTLNRSVITGQQHNNSFKNVPISQEGYLETSIRSPLLPFGSVHVEHLLPIFQIDAVYGINDRKLVTGKTFSGSVTTSNSMFVLSSGTTPLSQVFIQSRRRLRYRAGQGIVAKFTAAFSNPVNNSFQVAGIGTTQNGLFFGYRNTQFGVFYNKGGLVEIRRLTITAAATTNDTITITLNGTSTTITIGLVFDCFTIEQTTWEIFNTPFDGWKTSIDGDSVLFMAYDSAPKVGLFSVATSGSFTGTFSTVQTAVATTQNFIAQSSWNGDKLDGTGASGMTMDWTKGNIFIIGLQYLGFGCITFSIETYTLDTTEYTTNIVHMIKLPNTLVVPSFSNPTFPFSALLYSIGSTTNLTLSIPCCSGFTEGARILTDNNFIYSQLSTNVNDSKYFPIISLFNTRYFLGIHNHNVVKIISIQFTVQHTSICSFIVVKMSNLKGAYFEEFTSQSCSFVDTRATEIDYSDDKLVYTGDVVGNNTIIKLFDNEVLDLQPGEWLTVAAQTFSDTAAFTSVVIKTNED